MKPQYFAILSAIAWGIGGFLEKRGVATGHITPAIGVVLRCVATSIILGIAGWQGWKEMAQADWRGPALIIIGGGVISGSIGMLSYYAALRDAPLSIVMPIAFSSPMIGAIMGIVFGGEPFTIKTLAGIGLTVSGIFVLSYGS
jgi:bacterial/archaeal transporter family protein